MTAILRGIGGNLATGVLLVIWLAFMLAVLLAQLACLPFVLASKQLSKIIP